MSFSGINAKNGHKTSLIEIDKKRGIIIILF